MIVSFNLVKINVIGLQTFQRVIETFDDVFSVVSMLVSRVTSKSAQKEDYLPDIVGSVPKSKIA
jgi:hypothetical protein